MVNAGLSLMANNDRKNDNAELHKDAWERFERAIDVVSKVPAAA
jgi:fructose 1,6-bisphosphatase